MVNESVQSVRPTIAVLVLEKAFGLHGVGDGPELVFPEPGRNLDVLGRKVVQAFGDEQSGLHIDYRGHKMEHDAMPVMRTSRTQSCERDAKSKKR